MNYIRCLHNNGKRNNANKFIKLNRSFSFLPNTNYELYWNVNGRCENLCYQFIFTLSLIYIHHFKLYFTQKLKYPIDWGIPNWMECCWRNAHSSFYFGWQISSWDVNLVWTSVATILNLWPMTYDTFLRKIIELEQISMF